MICLDAAIRLRAFGVPAPASILGKRAVSMKPHGLKPKAKSASPSLAKIHECFSRIVSARGAHRLLDIAMATVVSVDLSIEGGTPLLWLIAPGPASSGKTEAVMPLRGYRKAKFVDSLTTEAFASGYKDKKSKRGKSLLDELDGRSLVIRDMSTFFSAQDTKVKKLLGDLASIHDGMFSKATANETEGSSTTDYENRFSFIAGVTPASLKKHHNYMATIGAKFLMVRVPPATAEEKAAAYTLADDPKKAEHIKALNAAVHAHLDDVIAKREAVQITKAQGKRLEVMSELVAQGRTLVSWEPVFGEGVKRYEKVIGETEGSVRAYQQLRTLLRSLAMVRGHAKPTVEDMDDVRHLALSSVTPERGAILRLLIAAPVLRGSERGLTAQACVRRLKISERTAQERLADLVALRLLVESGTVPHPEGDAGATSKFYVPALRFSGLFGGREAVSHGLAA
jgi:hypothetical protein